MKGNVPMCYRGEIWQNMIGNELRINSQVYNAFNNDPLLGRASDVDVDGDRSAAAREGT